MTDTSELSGGVQESQKTCEFIKSLKDERLDWLVMNPPLGDDIIEHGLVCKLCAARIANAVRASTIGI